MALAVDLRIPYYYRGQQRVVLTMLTFVDRPEHSAKILPGGPDMTLGIIVVDQITLPGILPEIWI